MLEKITDSVRPEKGESGTGIFAKLDQSLG